MKRIMNRAFTRHLSSVRYSWLAATFLALTWPASAQNAVTLTPVINTLSSNLGLPAGSAYDGAGHIYVTDTYHCELLKIDAVSGATTIVAGTGTCGSNGNGMAATATELNEPTDVKLDMAGNLYIADDYNEEVRMVSATTGVVTQFAIVHFPSALAFDGAGDLYISDAGDLEVLVKSKNNGNISVVAGGGSGCSQETDSLGDGCPATSAILAGPLGLALDRSGNLYIADFPYSGSPNPSSYLVRKVSAITGIITIFAGGGSGCSQETDSLGDGCPAASATVYPTYLTVDAAGNLYIDDADNINEDEGQVRKVSAATSIISLIAGTGAGNYTGDGGPATQATFGLPWGIAIDPAGNVYVADDNFGVMRKINSATAPVTFPATAVGGLSVAQNVLVTINSALTLSNISVQPLPSGKHEFNVGTISGCALGTSISAGTICTVPVTFSPGFPGQREAPLVVSTSLGTFQFGLQGVGQAPNISITSGVINTVAGGGTGCAGQIDIYGDGCPATEGYMLDSGAVALDSSGDIFVIDKLDNLVREVNAVTGIITTVAGNGTQGFAGDGGPATSAELYQPLGLALDDAGDIFIADTGNLRIRMVAAGTGIITTVAGNGSTTYSGDGLPATVTGLNNPKGVAIDPYGNLFVSDSGNYAVRTVNTATGIISTFAGNGTQGDTGDGGPATFAELTEPEGLAFDFAGDLYLIDFLTVRRVSSGIINTVAGNGSFGYSGDGGGALSAELGDPANVAVDPGNNFYIADTFNNVIRVVNPGTGLISTIAGDGFDAGSGMGAFSGDGGPAVNAEMFVPQGIALDGFANFYIGDFNNQRVREVSAAGAPLAFPPTAKGSTSPSQTVTVTNTGNTTLNISLVTASANFTVDPNTSTCSTTIPLTAGNTCLIGVYFSPLSNGTFSGSLNITDNALNASGATQTVPLSGTTVFPTAVYLTASPNPSSGGQTVMFSALVDASSGVTPTGTVTFYNGASSIGLADLSSGVANLKYAGLTTGTHSITATFNGSPTAAASTSPVHTQTVNSEATATVLASSPNPSSLSQSVAFTATVTAGDGATPAGAVVFKNGATSIGTVSLINGKAVLNYAGLPGGTNSITADYTGSNMMTASTSPVLSQTVSKAASNTTLVSSVNPSSGGQPVTFTATITPAGPPAPTGTVAFRSNGTTITGCSAVVATASRTAACTTTAQPVGTNSIEAVYAGNASYLTSTSATLSQVVNIATTNTALVSSVNPSTGGLTVRFTATVTAAGGGTPTGTVTFYNGATSIGAVTLSGGVAKLNYASLVAGTHSITATYGGSSTDTTSTSAVLSQVVNLDTTTTSLATSPNPSNTGISVTMTATVTPGNGVAATGTVSFYSGSTLLGNVSLSGGTATLSHVFNTTGTYSLTAKYTGSNYKNPSMSNTVSQIVDPD